MVSSLFPGSRASTLETTYVPTSNASWANSSSLMRDQSAMEERMLGKARDPRPYGWEFYQLLDQAGVLCVFYIREFRDCNIQLATKTFEETLLEGYLVWFDIHSRALLGSHPVTAANNPVVQVRFDFDFTMEQEAEYAIMSDFVQNFDSLARVGAAEISGLPYDAISFELGNPYAKGSPWARRLRH